MGEMNVSRQRNTVSSAGQKHIVRPYQDMENSLNPIDPFNWRTFPLFFIFRDLFFVIDIISSSSRPGKTIVVFFIIGPGYYCMGGVLLGRRAGPMPNGADETKSEIELGLMASVTGSTDRWKRHWERANSSLCS